MAMSVATWSLRERAVWSLPPTGPTISVSRLVLDAVEPVQQRVAVLVGDDPGLGDHPDVRPRLLDVVRAEPPVEADRRVELLEDGVLRDAETRHRAA
jgi:hypothetical protein